METARVTRELCARAGARIVWEITAEQNVDDDADGPHVARGAVLAQLAAAHLAGEHLGRDVTLRAAGARTALSSATRRWGSARLRVCRIAWS